MGRCLQHQIERLDLEALFAVTKGSASQLSKREFSHCLPLFICFLDIFFWTINITESSKIKSIETDQKILWIL